MERTNKTSEECDQLLKSSEFFLSSNVNIGYNKNNSSDEEDNIELRHKNEMDVVSSSKRYAEVSQSYSEINNYTKRFSDLALEALSNIHKYDADDERQSLIQEEDIPNTLDESRNSTMTDTGAIAEDECTSSGEYSETSSNRQCEIGILERLLRTHSLWFLPGIQRSGAVHLLQGKEPGNFIVRGSSQQNTMAISVRLPMHVGPYIEHYLIISQGGVLSLENSREKFDSIPALIAHYSSVSEEQLELPVQLCLPKPLREINNRQKLSSLALLGQEFWQSTIACSKNDLTTNMNNILSPTDTSSGIGLTIFSSNTDNTLEQSDVNCLSPMSDTISTMSSFSLNNTQPILSPTSSNGFSCTESSPIVGKTSTFKLPARTVVAEPLNLGISRTSSGSSDCSRTSQNNNFNEIPNLRPQSPNTLNLKGPPTPPPRLSKISMTPSDSSNFSVTFTFSTQQQELESFPCDIKRLSPEGECNNTKNSEDEAKILKDKNEKLILPTTSKRNRRKDSKHYQESDILESAYCRSGLSEKQSDYEDLWTQNDAINSPIGRTLSSFRSVTIKNEDSKNQAKSSGLAVLTPINVNPNISTNPFLSNKLHQSSNNLCFSNATEYDSHFNVNKLNRFSLDLSSNHIAPPVNNINKEWTPFEDSKEFEEANRRTVTDDTIKIAHSQGKRRAIAFDAWMMNRDFAQAEQTMKNTTLLLNKKLFLHTLILNKFPDLSFDYYQTINHDNENFRQSKYDNVDSCRHSDTTYSDCTRYSDPWHWEPPYQIDESSSSLNEQNDKIQKTATISRHRNRENQHKLIHPQNRSSNISPGESVEAYALELAKNSSSTFAKNVENFISCTKESHETAPQVVMRNMRQFMSGMKNYLVKHGEGNFQTEVQHACARLKPNEFLNLDTILENVMHILVVLPLKEHLYKLFVDFYTNSGDLRLLIDNIKIASEKNPSDLGIEESKITLPDGPELLQLSMLVHRMEELELPLEKLNVLFTLVSSIFKFSKSTTMNADDFLPILIYVVAKTGFIASEIEAEFIWGLINPSLLSGEAGYYLTAICSAVHMLKNFSTDLKQKPNCNLVSTPNASSTIKVIIPDECNGSLQTRTLPVRPNTTVRELSRIIAHKARITNSQDYGLFKLVEGEETLLQDNECPQEVAVFTQKKCVFIYHRLDAKIAWPTLT